MMMNLMTILVKKVFISSKPTFVYLLCPPLCGPFSIQESAAGGLSYKVKKQGTEVSCLGGSVFCCRRPLAGQSVQRFGVGGHASSFGTKCPSRGCVYGWPLRVRLARSYRAAPAPGPRPAPKQLHRKCRSPAFRRYAAAFSC